MPQIFIEEDVYNHLLRNTSFFGENASSILRRMLGLKQNIERTIPYPILPDSTDQHLSEGVRTFLESPRFLLCRDAVGRFLEILRWLHESDPVRFQGVLRIQGRQRLYFAKERDALENSGSSVAPQQIPETDVWVVTNNDTPKKRRILEDVLALFQLGPGDKRALSSAIG